MISAIVDENLKRSFRHVQNALKLCFDDVCMTVLYVCLERHVSSRHFEIETEYYYAWILSRYKVFQQTNQNVGNEYTWNNVVVKTI